MGEDEGWHPMDAAIVDGTLCDLRYRDALGSYTVAGPFFLHDDGHWYRVDPPMQITSQPRGWRPMQEPTP